MAEILDTLRLDIDQALRDITRVEQALDRSLAPVELRIDVDDTAVQRVEDSLRDVRTVAEDTTDQVRLTADEYREVARAIETGVTPARAIADATGQVRTQADLAEADFRDLARVLNISEEAARDLTREVLDSEQAAERLEDAARDVARQLGLSDREAERLAGSLREADRAADAIDVTTIGLAGRFAALRSSAVLIGGALAGIGGTALLVGALSGANAAIQSFARLEDSINAVNVIFGEAGAAVVTFGEDAAASAGLSQEAFNQAVVPIGALLQNFGFDAGEAAAAAVILVQRGADLASVYGGTVQDALLAVGAALRGEADPLERYGASISAARVETFALNEGLAQTKAEITPAIALQARYGLILSDTAAVSGDFANTSGDLANAQRIAAGEVQNFVTEVGEHLAPALESVLVLLPEFLEGVRQLVPGFAAGAESAADFFEAVGEGGGFRTEFAAIAAGFDVVTGGAGLATEAGRTLFSVFTGNMKGAADAVQRGGALIERAFTRGIAVTLANSLDKGVDSLTAFRTAMTQTAASSSNLDLFTGNFRDFAIAAGLSKDELYEVTLGLYNNATQLGLTADEVDFLRDQLDLLNETLETGSRRGYTDYDAAVSTLGESFSTTTSRFTVFAGELETTQTRSSAALAQLAADTEAQLGRAGAAFDLFGELPEQLEGSFADFVEGLQEQVEAQVDFDINLAILQALGLDQLAAEFDEAGVAAATQLQEAVDNIPLAIEADRAARGFADDLGDTFEDELINRLIAIGISSAEARQIAEALVSPQVIAAAEAAATVLANRQLDTYREDLLGGFEQLVPEVAGDIETHTSRLFDHPGITREAGRRDAEEYVDGITGFDIEAQIERIFAGLGVDIDLFDDGQQARSTFVSGLATRAAGEAAQVRDSIVNVLDDAIERDSPPKLFLRAGQESGDAFWSGFDQAQLTLRTPAQLITGSVAGSTTAATNVVEGGFTFAPTVINPTVQDLETTLARQGQLFGAVSGLLGKIKLS